MIVSIVGAPSCRKTTSAERLVSELKLQGYNAIFCPEFARDYKVNHKTIDDPFEQLYVTLRQLEREGDLEEVYDIVVCDSSVWLGAVYAQIIHEFSNNKHLEVMKYLDTLLYGSDLLYNRTFFMPIEEPVVKDGVREQEDEDRQEIQDKILAYMAMNDIHYVTVSGTVEDKVNFMVEEIIKSL